MPEHVLIVGASTRAAAESAARAGLTVTAIDAFADRDQHPTVHAVRAGRFTTREILERASAVECDSVVYLANFENHPDAVGELAANRALWGNTPETLRQVRSPLVWTEALRTRDVPVLDVARQAPASGSWLAKPVASGGGLHIHRWRAGERLSKRLFLQQYVEGVPASIAFVADRRRAVPIALTRQVIGDAAFGAGGFQYCGSILSSADGASDPELPGDALMRIAQALVDEFELVGLNGVDVVVHDGVPYATEINPRWCASMEVAERASARSVLAAHRDACVHGRLPSPIPPAIAIRTATGKAIVFARQPITVRSTDHWLAGGNIRDVPRAGEQIAAGHPVCSVFAEGRDAAECYQRLVEQAAQVYAELHQWSISRT